MRNQRTTKATYSSIRGKRIPRKIVVATLYIFLKDILRFWMTEAGKEKAESEDCQHKDYE